MIVRGFVESDIRLMRGWDGRGRPPNTRWYRKRLANKSVHMVLLWERGVPIAWGQIDYGPRCELRWFTHPRYRRHGAAKALAEKLKLMAGQSPVIASILPTNTPSIRVAKSIGLRPSSKKNKKGFIIFRED